MLIMPQSRLASDLDTILGKIRRGCALARADSQNNPPLNMMVDLPEGIDFEITVIRTHQSAAFQRLTTISAAENNSRSNNESVSGSRSQSESDSASTSESQSRSESESESESMSDSRSTSNSESQSRSTSLSQSESESLSTSESSSESRSQSESLSDSNSSSESSSESLSSSQSEIGRSALSNAREYRSFETDSASVGGTFSLATPQPINPQQGC